MPEEVRNIDYGSIGEAVLYYLETYLGPDREDYDPATVERVRAAVRKHRPIDEPIDEGGPLLNAALLEPGDRTFLSHRKFLLDCGFFAWVCESHRQRVIDPVTGVPYISVTRGDNCPALVYHWKQLKGRGLVLTERTQRDMEYLVSDLCATFPALAIALQQS